ncbi:MAG: hypothetical protein MJ133_10505 [Lachnospiraceae bacterium]|nr:hypothetical protein [Lachnospiraceae bacterium]
MSKVYCTHRKLNVEDKNEHCNYSIIKDQFDCIVDYLGWDMLFYKPFYATDMNDLRNNKEIMAELEKLGSQI